MLISSEYVSLGHPDRTCDMIAANLINRIQQNDKENSHAAIEVFASDDTIVFGGEAKTTLKLNKKFLRDIVAGTFETCGYTENRRKSFTKNEVYLAKDVKIVNKIHAQSPDIALATTNLKTETGYNDQGLYFGSFDSLTPSGQGVGKFLAQSFGEFLFDETFAPNNSYIGSDIKIVFTLDVDDKDCYTPKSIKHVTVAIPIKGRPKDEIKNFVIRNYNSWKENSYFEKSFPKLYKLVKESNPDFTVNGTGRYVNHGFHSDASMTGRKLAVNNMSAGPVYSQCQCGGGSYIKPWHASDFLLPMVGNWIAKAIVVSGLSKYANVSLACTIGGKKLDSLCITGDATFNKNIKLKNKITEEILKLDLSPNGLAKRWNLTNGFDFYAAVELNFVNDDYLSSTAPDKFVPWYNTKELEDLIENVKKSIN